MKKNEVIDDWIDRDEVRALARKLMAPCGEPPKSLDDSVYGEAFEGFVEPEKGAKVEPLPWAVQAVPGKGPEKVRKKEVVSPPPVTRSGQPNPFQKKSGGEPSQKRKSEGKVTSPFRAPTSARAEEEPVLPAAAAISSVEAFVTWLRGEIPLEKTIVFGPGGEVLFDDLKNGKLMAVIRMLARAAKKKKPEKVRSLVVKLGPGKVMQVISFPETRGASAVGLVLPRPLADGGVEAFVKALKKALA